MRESPAPPSEPGDAVLDRVACHDQEHVAQMPSARRRGQASKPSMPGSITSSTTASYGVAAAIHRSDRAGQDESRSGEVHGVHRGAPR